jgi:protein-tyrosine-phosphatase
MSAMKHVLFVCTGNTCRSPMAEGLFRLATRDREDFFVSSAGVSASRGAPCNPETASLLGRRGTALENFGSRAVSDAILAEATHIFAMTQGHLQVLESRFPQHSDKFYLTCEFADIPGEGIGADIPDPIGLGSRAYEEVAEILGIAIPSIIAYIDQSSPKD